MSSEVPVLSPRPNKKGGRLAALETLLCRGFAPQLLSLTGGGGGGILAMLLMSALSAIIVV
jgi:hypothetical protein